MLGRTISHYAIREKLGEGGMGVVYLADDVRLGRPVAIKVLAPDYSRDPQRRRRFEQEARAAAALNHPGIATVYDLQEIEGELYIIQEYVAGSSLRTLVGPAPLGLERLLDLAVQVARALEAAHAKAIVHRDLKPENVILTPDGAPKILDFGLACLHTPGPEGTTQSLALTRDGVVVGTPAYMSPEQLEAREVDSRSDIFSFGVLLYELATAEHPFQAGSTASTIANIMTREPEPVQRHNPLSPPELDRIVRKCLRKRREERYQTTQDLVVDLEALRRESGDARRDGTAPSPAPAPHASSRQLLTPRNWWLLNLVHVLPIYGLAVYLAWRVKPWIDPPWGQHLFLAVILAVIPPGILRMILFNTYLWARDELPSQVKRLSAWIRYLSMVQPALLMVAGIFIVEQHNWWGALLLTLGTAGTLLPVSYDPLVERAAFPGLHPQRRSAEEVTEEHRRADFTRLALIQTAFTLPWLLVTILCASLLEENLSLLAQSSLPEQALVVVMVMALSLALLVFSAAVALYMWRRDVGTVRHFSRWFVLYLVVDCLAIVAIFGVAFARLSLPVALLLLPLLAYLPFYQRRLARGLLASPGD